MHQSPKKRHMAPRLRGQEPPAEAKGPSQHRLTANATRRSVSPQNPFAIKGDASYRRVAPKASKGAVAKATQEEASESLVAKPSKPAELNAQQQDASEDEHEIKKSNEIVVASGEGRRKRRTASDKQNPWKKSDTAASKRVFCAECLQRKNEPGNDGRRRNAKHNCEKCGELSMAADQPERTRGSPRTDPAAGQERPISPKQNTRGASQPAPGKPKIRTRPFEPHHQVEWDSDLSTQSDDPNNPPIPNALNPTVNKFGVKRDLSRSSLQIQENRPQWNKRPRSEAVVRKPDFDGAQDQPRLVSDAAPALAHPFQTANPAWLTTHPSSVAEESSIYPDPTPYETRPTNYFEDAAAIVDLSRAAASSTEPLSSGAWITRHTFEAGTSSSSTYQAAPSNFCGVSSAANQPPADPVRDPYHSVHEPLAVDPRLLTESCHPGLKVASNNPILPGDFTRFSIAQAFTNNGPGEAGSHRHLSVRAANA